MSHTENLLDYEDNHQNPDLFLASKGSRFANYIIDRIGMYLFMILLVWIFDTITVSSEVFSDLGLLVLLFSLFGYWILFEYYFGKTPAKFLTQTKVVTKYGEKPSFLKIVGRTLCRFIPFEPFSFFGSDSIGWHDSISETRVVIDSYETKQGEYV